MANIEIKTLRLAIPEGTTHYQGIDLSNDAAVRFFKFEGEEKLVWAINAETRRPGWVPIQSNHRGPLLPISYGLGTTDQLGGDFSELSTASSGVIYDQEKIQRT